MALITEDHLEQQCLEWFQDFGYSRVFAPDLDSEMRTIAHMPEQCVTVISVTRRPRQCTRGLASSLSLWYPALG
jgi:hypothetical protein